MIALLALLVLSAVSLVWYISIRALYRRTGDFLYPAGGVLIYLWTFFGAWWFIGDSLSGFQGYRIGLVYYYYMERMLPFVLDANYVLGLLAYGLFAVALSGTLWWLRTRAVAPDPSPVRVDHRALLLAGLLCMVGSLLCVLPNIQEAWRENVSFYSVIRGHPGRWSALHGILNEAATCCLLFGYAIALVSSHPRALFTGTGARWPLVAYPVALSLFGLYLSLIGDRHALFAGLILSILYIFGRAGSGAWKRSILLIGVTVGCLFFGGWVRGFSAREMATLQSEQVDEGPFRVPMIAHVPRHAKGLVARAGSSVLSNEFFAAHFSMYAVLTKRVPVEPFISFKYLAGSAVPSFIRGTRPVSAYDHYATSAGFDPRTGYTIHHATAWYLNFGWVGLALGGFCMGAIWGGLNKLRASPRTAGRGAWASFLPYLFVAFLPTLLRTGPEGFRALLIEGFGIPLAVLLAAAWVAKRTDKGTGQQVARPA